MFRIESKEEENSRGRRGAVDEMIEEYLLKKVLYVSSASFVTLRLLLI